MNTLRINTLKINTYYDDYIILTLFSFLTITYGSINGISPSKEKLSKLQRITQLTKASRVQQHICNSVNYNISHLKNNKQIKNP